MEKVIKDVREVQQNVETDERVQDCWQQYR